MRPRGWQPTARTPARMLHAGHARPPMRALPARQLACQHHQRPSGVEAGRVALAQAVERAEGHRPRGMRGVQLHGAVAGWQACLPIHPCRVAGHGGHGGRVGSVRLECSVHFTHGEGCLLLLAAGNNLDELHSLCTARLSAARLSAASLPCGCRGAPPSGQDARACAIRNAAMWQTTQADCVSPVCPFLSAHPHTPVRLVLLPRLSRTVEQHGGKQCLCQLLLVVMRWPACTPDDIRVRVPHCSRVPKGGATLYAAAPQHPRKISRALLISQVCAIWLVPRQAHARCALRALCAPPACCGSPRGLPTARSTPWH